MIRIKLNFYQVDFVNPQFNVTNVNDEHLGLLTLDQDKTRWLFVGIDLFSRITDDSKSMFWIDNPSTNYAQEKINMLVDKYINRFLEKE